MCELKARFSQAFKHLQQISHQIIELQEIYVFDAEESTNQTLWQ